jgi:membrane-bound inhibitor of C-type lysozyme
MQTITKQTPLSFFVALMLLAAALAVPLAFAAPTVSTDKASYSPGDALSVSGTATADAIVSIQVFDPDGTRVAIAQATAGTDGAYSATVYTFKTADSAGTWTVKAYQGGVTAETTVTFTTEAVTPPTVTPTTELEKKVAILEDEVDTLSGTITSLKKTVSDLESQVADIETIEGPAGATGPAGPAGATGPAGPAGEAAETSMISYVAIVIGIIAIIIAIVSMARKPKA